MVRSLVRGLVLVAASLTLAAPALAGFNYPFGAACNDIFNPWDSLDDPNSYSGNLKCDTLCKTVEKDCEKFTKDAASCQSTLVKDNEDFAKKECDELTGVERTNCRDAANSQAQIAKAAIGPAKDSAVSLCKEWGAECQADCGPM